MIGVAVAEAVTQIVPVPSALPSTVCSSFSQ